MLFFFDFVACFCVLHHNFCVITLAKQIVLVQKFFFSHFFSANCISTKILFFTFFFCFVANNSANFGGTFESVGCGSSIISYVL